MDRGDDEYLRACCDIETGLVREYESNPGLTDSKVVYALDNAKIAVKHTNGYGKNEKIVMDHDTTGIIELCTAVGRERMGETNGLSLKEYLSQIDKVKRSVKRHSEYGRRGYYEFVKDYVESNADDEPDEDLIGEANPHLKETILEAVDNQLRDNDPPETRLTLDRLQKEGISEEDARIYIGQALTVEIWDTMRNEKAFNPERYKRNLKNLPSEPREV